MPTTPNTTPNVKTITGNRVIVEFGGVQVGAVQSVRMSDNYARESVSGIGDIHSLEFPPTRAEHSISVSNMTLYVGNMRQAGISPINGDDVLQGLELDIVSYSRDTGAVLRKYEGCSFDSGETSVDAHRIVMQSSQWKCRDVTGSGF
jgi:hypothetical protein